MSERPRVEEALGFLHGQLAAGRPAKSELTTGDAWLAFKRFGRQRFDTAPVPDSDGLLFQYGTYAFSGRPMFTVDLWFFHDADAGLDEWFAALERHLKPLLARVPSDIDVYEELV
ncbi:hypothetical protein AB0F11_37865 [Streptomyces sp. NPDC032472]|uniref:hypothetical protein n=1 Tax=Streptomyces sp. NPDC032472 TaxID=3155018 RepID=UPI0033E8AA06